MTNDITSMSVDETRAIVERWFQDIFTQGNLVVVDELVAPEFIAHGQGNDEGTHGREAFKDWLHWYRSTFTDAEWTIGDVISEGDKIVVRYSGWTTYRGGLLNIPSTNQRILESGIIIYRIHNGQVHEIWAEMSDLQVIQQLGIFPKRKQKVD